MPGRDPAEGREVPQGLAGAAQAEGDGALTAGPVLAATLVATLLWAGCIEGDPADDPARYRLGGSFTQDADQEDYDDLAARMGAYGADVAFLESFPVQFAVSGLSAEDCPTARAEAEGLPYVADVGDCIEQRTGGDGDVATPSS